MLRLSLAFCAVGLLAASLACSGGSGTTSATSSGSSWTVNSTNGNISGSYTLVYDDNGYVTEIHYNFKPFAVTVVPDGTVYCGEQPIGSTDGAGMSLNLFGSDRQFSVSRLADGSLRLVSAGADFPSITAIPSSTSAQ